MNLFLRSQAAIGTARDFEPTRGDRARQAQSVLVQIAEDYALAHAGDRLQVTDLCKVSGVSERSLEYAFKQVLGLPPVAYLIRLRLHRARQALLAADLETSTVTAIALLWGFGHLGEFARDYKACFGELPSETLMQRRVEIPNSEVEVTP